MRTYADYSHWSNEFQIDATLTLDDNESFSYSEDWHCYGAGFLRNASGTWRQDGNIIFLSCNYSEDGLFLTWVTGGEKQAVDSEDSIIIDGHFKMSLTSDDSVQTSEENKNAPLEKKAKLHFKDGRIIIRRLPNSLPNTLFTQTYYRLIDELSDRTYVFKAREDSANSDPRFIDYDEIEIDNSNSD